MKMKINTGKILFWIGFIITISIILAYIVLMVIDVTCFTTWLISLSVCGTVLVGAAMMLMGRSMERHAEEYI